MKRRILSGLKNNVILLFSLLALVACDDKPSPEQTQKTPLGSEESAEFDALTVTHDLGTTTITKRPVRVAALDMNEVDALARLDIDIVGMPKDFVPHFLKSYGNDANIADLGAIVQPNMERIYALKPDLVLMSSMQASHYKALSELAPTIHLDVDYQQSKQNHFEAVGRHLLFLGELFDKKAQAQQIVDALNHKLSLAQEKISARPEKAMVVLHNNGAFRFLGVNSRYGFVFNVLGVKPAKISDKEGLHGQPVSSEFLLQNNPDIIYVVDRTAVMEGRPTLDKNAIANPLIEQTNAWKNNNIVFVDPDAWYITAASVSSLEIIIDDVLRGYND